MFHDQPPDPINQTPTRRSFRRSSFRRTSGGVEAYSPCFALSRRLPLVAWALGGLLSLAPAQAQAATVSDAWITLETKLALLTQTHLSLDNVHVDTLDGLVTLYGTVISGDRKVSAANLAAKVKGAIGVRNLLQIVSLTNDITIDQEDGLIRTAVQNALQNDPRLGVSDISVQSVEKGAVLLAGTAVTLTAHLSALETAAAVPGVRSVASIIRAPDGLTDSEISDMAAGTKSSAGDGWTTAEVKLQLLADADVPALAISVDTDRGAVSLSGAVSSGSVEAAALADARKVSSVGKVIDDLQVVSTSGAAPRHLGAPVLWRDVEVAFKRYPELKRVDVQVRDGKVHLTGHVPTGWDFLLAATTARGVEGVHSVDEALQIQAEHPSAKP